MQASRISPALILIPLLICKASLWLGLLIQNTDNNNKTYFLDATWQFNQFNQLKHWELYLLNSKHPNIGGDYYVLLPLIFSLLQLFSGFLHVPVFLLVFFLTSVPIFFWMNGFYFLLNMLIATRLNPWSIQLWSPHQSLLKCLFFITPLTTAFLLDISCFPLLSREASDVPLIFRLLCFSRSIISLNS